MKTMSRCASTRAPLPAALLLATFFMAPPIAAQFAAGQESAPPLEGTSPEGNRYSVSVAPQRLAVGDLAIVELELEGVSASSASVAELRLDPGLNLESESLRPGSGSSSRRTDLRFELRVLGQGELKIEALAILAEGKTINIGPIAVCPGETPSAGGNRAGAWRWVVPPQVYRYEAFELRLESLGDRTAAYSTPAAGSATGAAPNSAAVFALPVGASIEASGRLSWTVIAFDEGDLLIPEAVIGSGPSAGKANATKVRVRPLPSELRTTRAIGRFTLALSESEIRDPVAGVPLRLSLVLEGRGNLPVLILPEPDIRLNGAALPRGAWTSSRVDEAKAEGGSYVGRASLVMEVIPPRAGVLTLSFPPLAVLDPSSVPKGPGASALALAVREIRVGSNGSAAAPVPRAPLAWGPRLSAASAAWARGEKSRALALLYSALRRAPPLSPEARDAEKAALACSALLGTKAPLLDALPPPSYFTIIASLVALLGLSLFIVAKVRGHSSRLARGGAVFLALALVLAGFGFASAAERREKFAVIWADSLRTVPSARSELSVSIIKGSTGRLRGTAGSYAGLVLADGVEGWAPLDSLNWY
jgi:hypothetical protein